MFWNISGLALNSEEVSYYIKKQLVFREGDTNKREYLKIKRKKSKSKHLKTTPTL